MWLCRMAPDLVVHRQELLHACMQDLLAANSNAPAPASLVAFLNPTHITCPMEQDTVTTPASPFTNSATHEAAPCTGSAPSADPDSSRGVHRGALHSWHGSRVRLLTDLPVRLTDREVLQRQQGCCAGCSDRLALPYFASSWLGQLHRRVSRCSHMFVTVTVYH